MEARKAVPCSKELKYIMHNTKDTQKQALQSKLIK